MHKSSHDVLNDCKIILLNLTQSFHPERGSLAAVFHDTIADALLLLEDFSDENYNKGLEALGRVLSMIESAQTMPEFERLSDEIVSGVTVSDNLDDVIMGIKVLHASIAPPHHRHGVDPARHRFDARIELLSNLMGEIESLVSERHQDVTLIAIPYLQAALERSKRLINLVRIADRSLELSSCKRLLASLREFQARYRRAAARVEDNVVLSKIGAALELAGDLANDVFDENTTTKLEASQPHQTLAPYQFSIESERLTVLRQPPHPKAGAENIAASALGMLLLQAEDVAEELKNSNHRRLERAFSRLKNALGSAANPIEIGMLCATYEAQVTSTSDELSESLLALLMSFTNGVTNYVSQFQEWQQFLENAAETRLEKEDGVDLSHIANVLATELERRQDVEKGVPEALRQVAAWNEKIDTPRSRLSVGRTVLNVVTVCFNAAVKQPLQKAVEVAGIAVIVVVLQHAVSHVAVLSKTPEGEWLRPAVKLIETYIGKLDKS